MPGFARVQAVLQGATNLPEDRFINTFHFEWFGTGETYETQAPVLAGAVEAFYLGEQSNSRALWQMMSPFITKITTSVYDLSVPEGEREPYTIELPWNDAVSTISLPEEVAVCLTMHGDPPVTPRRRGRIYIGPLMGETDVLTYATNVGPTRVAISHNQSIGNTILLAAAQLMEAVNFHWVIRSVTPAENFVNITGLWVDDAVDIIRKRGPDPTTRRTYPA